MLAAFAQRVPDDLYGLLASDDEQVQALDVVQRSDHFATLRTATGLSVALRRIAPSREDAMRIGEEVLDFSRRKFGNRNPDAMAALAGLDTCLGRDHDISLVIAVNLASDLAELGELRAARALGEDTHRRVKRVLGATHPLTLGAAANLSLDLRADGASEAAAELSAEVMRGYAETLSLNHPDALTAAEGRRLDFDFDPQPL